MGTRISQVGHNLPNWLYPRVGFIVTNLVRLTERPHRIIQPARHGGAEDQGKGRDQMNATSLAAPSSPMPSGSGFVPLPMRTLAMPKRTKPWSPTSLREKLIKTGAKVVRHGRYVILQLAEIAVPRERFAEILYLIARLRAPPAPA
jgi:hypothetical protein